MKSSKFQTMSQKRNLKRLKNTICKTQKSDKYQQDGLQKTIKRSDVGRPWGILIVILKGTRSECHPEQSLDGSKETTWTKCKTDGKTWFVFLLSCGICSLISIAFYFSFADMYVLCVVLTRSSVADASVPASLLSRPNTQSTVHLALASLFPPPYITPTPWHRCIPP